MIVECNSCGTKYRVREEKLPEGGGNIKCPSCAKVFFVKPPAKLDSSKLRPAGQALRQASGGVPGEDLATRVGTMPGLLVSGRTGSFPKFNLPDDNASLNTTVPRQAAIPSAAMPSGTAPPIPEPEPDLSAASWKLKTSFGLIYDFPDTESLRNWLSGRDDLSGYMLSHDAQNFKGLKGYAHLFPDNIKNKIMSAAEPEEDSGEEDEKPDPPKKQTMLGMPTSSGPQATESSSGRRATGPLDPNIEPGNSGRHKARPRPVRPKPRGGRSAPPVFKKTPVWVVPASLVLLAVLVVLVLQFTGVINLMGQKQSTVPPEPTIIPAVNNGGGNAEGEEYEDPFEEEGEETAGGNTPSSGNPLNSQGLADDLLEQAREEISNREYDTALESLTSAKGVAPNNPEVYRLLERVHSRLNDEDAARQAREKLNSLLDGADEAEEEE